MGLRRQTFSEAVDSARTAEEGLPKPGRRTTPITDNPGRYQKCTGCGRMGHEWKNCFRNPTSEYGKKIEAATVHQIQPHPATTSVGTDTCRTFRPSTTVQKYPCNLCGSMEHPGHRCPLLLDEDVMTTIKKKLPPPSTVSSVVITDINTTDVSHTGPRTRSQTHRQDLSVPIDDPSLHNLPRSADTFDWKAKEQLREEIIQTVQELQELSPTEPITPTITEGNSHTNQVCNTILHQIESHTIQVSIKHLLSIAPSISDHIQRYLFQQTNTGIPVPVPDEAPVPVHSVVAVDRHMPIITVTIGKTVINDVLSPWRIRSQCHHRARTLPPRITSTHSCTIQITNG